jgi:hypothetical protein
LPETTGQLEEPDEVAESEFTVEASLPADNFESIPSRSVPVSPEDLEHVEDKYLDAAYDEALLCEGDNLRPIPKGEEVLAEFFGEARKMAVETGVKTASTESRENNKALDIASRMSEEHEDDGEMPELPANPSEDDLLEYASKHPAVKSVARLFRGKVISVKKRN